MNGMGEMKPAGAEEGKKKKIQQQQQGQGPAVAARDKVVGAGATSILVVSSMPKTGWAGLEGRPQPVRTRR